MDTLAAIHYYLPRASIGPNMTIGDFMIIMGFAHLVALLV